MSKSDEHDYGTVEVCPHCERGGFKKRVGAFKQAEVDPEKTYYCGNCQTAFDEPMTRKRNTPNTTQGGLAVSEAQLEAAREALGIEVEDDE